MRKIQAADYLPHLADKWLR